MKSNFASSWRITPRWLGKLLNSRGIRGIRGRRRRPWRLLLKFQLLTWWPECNPWWPAREGMLAASPAAPQAPSDDVESSSAMQEDDNLVLRMRNLASPTKVSVTSSRVVAQPGQIVLFAAIAVGP